MDVMQLGSLIETRVSQAAVIVGVLDRLEAEIQRRHACSYALYFQTYRRLNAAVTSLSRQLGWRFLPNDISERLTNIHRKLRDIRAKRYERVCGQCDACATRRKPWPIASRVFHLDLEERTAEW